MELLIWFISSVISTLGVVYLFYKIMDKKCNIWLRPTIIFWIGVVLITLIQYKHLETIGNILYFIFYPILFYSMKPMNLKKLFYYVIMIWFYGMALDLIAMLAIALLHSFFEFNIYSYYFECILSCFVCIMLMIISYSKKLTSFTNNFYKKLSNVKFSDISLISFSIFTFLVGLSIFINLHNLNINLLLSLLLILVIAIFIILIRYKINEIENTIFLEKLKENNDFYIKVEDENRIFRHNLNAKLIGIKSVSNKEVKVLIDDLMYNNKKNVTFSKNIKDIPYGLNGIIYEKIYPYISNLNIKIDNNIKYDIFKVLKPRRYNVLVEKMVIAIDNAIEATLKSLPQILIINIDDTDSEIIVQIKNTFSNSIDFDELGIKNYSTKGKKRGLGLFSALRDNEASIDVKVVNDIFICKITAKKRLDD